MDLNFNNNSDRGTKRFLKFLIAILAVTGVFLGGYIWDREVGLQQASLLDNTLLNRFQENGEATISESLRFIKLTSEDSRFAVLSEDGSNLIYYVPASGEIKSVPVNGSGSSAGVAIIEKSAENITWSKNRKELILVRNGRSKYFDLSSGMIKELPANTMYPALSQFGDKLSYVSFNNNEGSGHINISDPRIEGFKQIMPTRSSYWISSWIGESLLSLYKPDSRYFELSSIYTLDIQKEKLVSIITLEKNLSFRWSPTGNKILYSSDDPIIGKLKLYVNNLSSGDKTEINLDTSASKCAWKHDETAVYCSKSEPGGDAFYEIGLLEEKGPIKIMTPDDNVEATDLILTSSGEYLVFRNLNNNRLYSVLLK